MDYPISVPSVGLVGGKFVDEDPLAGTPGSLIPAQWGNAVTEEILNVISAAGMSPSEVNNAQMIAAIRLINTAGSLLNLRIFSSAGTTTYTPTPGTKKVRVRVIGGGGGGGGAAATTSSSVAAGAGGSGGGYAEGIFNSGFSGVTVVVGVGGSAGAAGANAGGTGGFSSFGSLLSATGGEGGNGCAATSPPFSQGSGAAGVGSGSGGSIIAQGSGGSPSIITTLLAYQSGVGGGSAFGGGASQRRFNDQGSGRVGSGPGAGGSGGAAGGSGTTAALQGGGGAPGMVIIEEYS